MFCNLTLTSRGKPMVTETFRKFLRELVDGLSYTLLQLHAACRACKLNVTCELIACTDQPAASSMNPCGIRTHSCRRTAAYYAAWLGIPEATIKVYIYLPYSYLII